MSSNDISTLQMWDLKTVKNVTRLPTSSLYRLIANDTFPKPINLSPHRVAWLASEIETWLDERIAESRLPQSKKIRRRRQPDEEAQ